MSYSAASEFVYATAVLATSEHTACRVDLMQLVEEATEGCWIGHRARMFTSEIGSVYSPPKQGQSSVMSQQKRTVETVIDIGPSENVSFPILYDQDQSHVRCRVGCSNVRREVFDAFS